MQKKADGTATPKAACPASRCGQALISWLSAISGANRPPLARASVCGSRTAGRPEFIQGVQFRPLGRNSLTTFCGQTAFTGCPQVRGVRCRIAPCRSLCSPPTFPADRFGPRTRSHWGHAFLRDSSSLTCLEKAFPVRFSSAAYRHSSPRDRRKAYANFPGRDVSMRPVYFSNAKVQRGFMSTLDF